jgi:hypothetical protein
MFSPIIEPARTVPFPVQPIHIDSSKKISWDQIGRLKDDKDTIKTDEKESVRIGGYQLSGYDANSQNVKEDVTRLVDPMHYQKVYGNMNKYIDAESTLWMSTLSNMRYRNQVYTRPYVGYYCGPGMRSLGHKDLESVLLQSTATNLRQGPCQSCRGQPTHRFMCLPEFGNPQREEHIIPPPESLGGWIRGGLPSRDLVRRIDYQRRCANQENNQVIKKVFY